MNDSGIEKVIIGQTGDINLYDTITNGKVFYEFKQPEVVFVEEHKDVLKRVKHFLFIRPNRMDKILKILKNKEDDYE